MSKEKYLANIDRVLTDVIRKNSKSIADQNKIEYSCDMEKSGAIRKVAFDVYKVDNDPYDGLWLVEDIGGKPFLIRASDEPAESEEANDGSWIVTSNMNKDQVTLSYNKFPIAAFSSEKYNFSKDDIFTFKSAILDNIKNDETFVKDLLLEQPESKRQALVRAFPEFKKFI